MERSKLTRSDEVREKEEREFVWKPADILPAPDFDKHPDWDFRYVRVSTRTGHDNMNLSSALRNGWEPVKSSEVPEIKAVSDRNSDHPEGVLIGGMLLCKRPKSIGVQVREYADNESRAQIDGIERQYMNEDDRRMKKFADRKSRTTNFG